MTHAHLLDRMASYVDAWQNAGDRRMIFLACYALMTRNMLGGLDAGRFADRAWVYDLVHNFAEYYFVALEAYERGDDRVGPHVWRQAHDLTRAPHMPPIVHLLLGVNAHINCDLVLVLDDMLRAEWANLSAEMRRQRHHDYLMVNTIIGETIDIVQDTVLERYSPAMEMVDVAFGSLDEWCTHRLIRNWRDDVWRRAQILVATDDPRQRELLRAEADTRALDRMRLLVSGGSLGARAFGYSQRWLQRLRLV